MSRVTITTDIVENAKRELIEKIISNIDMDRIREICTDVHGIKEFERVDFSAGDITAYQDAVAYFLEFEVTFKFPVLLDGEGNALQAGVEEAPAPDTPEERVENYAGEAAHAAHEL